MAYATVTDVLRVLGGTKDLLQQVFGRLLWSGAVTSVTVDGNTFDVPDTLLARMADRLEVAESLVNSYVMQAYKSAPTTVPPHLRDATAFEAARRCLTTDGTLPERFRDEAKSHAAYLKSLAAGELDLGLTSAPIPESRRPRPYFARGCS